MVFPVKHISISINSPVTEIYEFVSNPENLPKWASGLSSSIRKEGENWVADSPMGTVIIKFANKNKFGILDHDVTLPSGIKIHIPMRVFPNNEGSEIIFTLYKVPNMSDYQFIEDIKLVEKDLKKLKNIFEK